MDSKDILEEYNKCDYIEKASDANPELMRYKYRSPIGFVDFIQEIDNKGIRYAKHESSHKSGDWSGSRNFKEAVDLFREAKFSSQQARRSNHLIINMRQGIRYNDDNGELSVPEHLSGNRNCFIEHEFRKRRRPLVLKTPIIIDLAVMSDINQTDIQRASLRIINKLYEHQIRVPKIILSYLSSGTGGRGDHFIFVDVPYFDFNSLIRFTIPSTWRRLAFRNLELISGLSSSYGFQFSLPRAQNLSDVIRLCDFVNLKDEDIDNKMDEIIENTLKLAREK